MPTNNRPCLYVLYALLALLPAACGGGGSGSASDSSASAAITPPPVVEEVEQVEDAGESERPNVLLVMVDDLGFNDLAINNGNPAIDTPNLDQLARDGVRFTRHYATTVCSPGRAALLTGLYPERLGYLPNGRGISPQVTTLPERLSDEGYTTWHIGKWHIGDLQRAAWPDRQGFDHWFGFLSQFRLAGKQESGELVPARPRYNNPWLQGDREPGRHFEGHLENILTEAAIDAITEMDGERAPWFLNLWFYAPHTPISPAHEFASRYPDSDAGRYRALVNQLDSNVGRLLAHLDALNLADNTIVIVVSDNGGTNRILDNNAPWHGTKGSLTEGGLRTPLLIRWPRPEHNGYVYDQIVSITDIYPTLLEALGIPINQPLDGHSFYRSTQGLEPPAQRPLFWELGDGSGQLSADGDWRLHITSSIYGLPSTSLLYDLAADSSGARPVDPPPAAVLTDMQRRQARWYRDVHVVDTHLQSSSDGTARLTGMDFQRTPGEGHYSVAIGVTSNGSGSLMDQQGVWSLHREGNTITARFGAAVLSGEITGGAACHSIILSGLFYRELAFFTGEDSITMSLYIDGQQQQRVSRPGVLEVEDTQAPTVIGDPNIPASELQPPIILNTAVTESTPITLQALHQQVCPG